MSEKPGEKKKKVGPPPSGRQSFADLKGPQIVGGGTGVGDAKPRSTNAVIHQARKRGCGKGGRQKEGINGNSWFLSIKTAQRKAQARG